MSFICGVDPGLKGGMAFVGIETTIVYPMHDAKFFAELLSELLPSHVFLEKAQTMPKQGIVSAFNYGRGFGELLGVIIARGVPYTLVTPQQWTRTMHVGATGKTTKDKSIQVAKRLWPATNFKASPASRKDHDGLAEAALIAEWGRRHLGQR